MAYVDENSVTTLTNQIKAFVQSSFLDMIYPVGSIYLSVEDTNPSTLFGGSWVQIKDTFLLSAGDSYTGGVTGGKAIYSADDMPSHTHTRGTMNITGGFAPWSENTTDNREPEGAFYKQSSNQGGWGTSSGVDKDNPYMNFDASRSWTGETSQSGTNTYATILPPYLVVYMWKRTA